MDDSFQLKLFGLNKQQHQYQTTLSDELREKNWDLNQIKMSDNLNELIRKIKMKKESSDLNKSIEEKENTRFSSPSSKPLDENSSTAEFRKYLEDLKKSYLEKLTFSCPSKLLTNSLNLTDAKKSKMIDPKNISTSLRSSENISNLLLNSSNNNNKTSLSSIGGNNSNNVRRSLLYDYNKNDSLLNGNNGFDDKNNLHTKSNINIFSLNDKLNNNEKKLFDNDKNNLNGMNLGSMTMINHKDENTSSVLTPDLTKTQMLSRLVQIREYLKQAYTMLATLQTSNDLANYASQMNKLHSLIDNLKDQEKSYMDLLESFNELTSTLSIKNVSLDNDSNENCQKDVLDISELNESLNQITNSQSKLNKSLNESKQSTSGYSSFNKKPSNTDDLTSTNTYMSSNDSNSISGSFISDTITLNNQNDLEVKYNKKNSINNNNKSLNKSNYNYDDEKTDNDQDNIDEDFEMGFDLKEKQNSIREQRKEIFKELDKDLVTLEQLREQKQLLRSIRLRKEELKALEGRRKALEALKKIAVDGENDLDDAFDVLKNKTETPSNYSSTNDMQNVKELDEFSSFLANLKREKDDVKNESDNESKVTTLTRKTACFKFNDEVDENVKIEPSTQIEKSKKTVKHFEDIMNRNSNNNSLIYNQNDEETETSAIKDDCFRKNELNERLASLAENEKKLEELYSMQSRLSQLKEVINQFNGLSDITKSIEINPDLKIDYDETNLIGDVEETVVPEKEEALNEELLQEHKKKLSTAKDKLKQLQDLISRLQLLSKSDNENINSNNEMIAQENDGKAENVNDEKEMEISNKMKQLEDLKINKQKLVDLLKEKETESANLAKLYMNLRNQRGQTNESSDLANENLENEHQQEIDEDEESQTLVNNDLYLENKFSLAENDFDTLSLDNINDKKSELEYKHSPSDYLWLEMKKQLNMRENLRSKKKELEDLIQNENSKAKSLLIDSYLSKGGENKQEDEQEDENEDDEKDYYEESNNNDIINGYREFFLRKKSNSIKEEEQEKQKNSSGCGSNCKSSPRVIRQKQENICSPEELINEEMMRNKTESIYLMKDDDLSKIDPENIEGVLLKSFPEKQQQTINELSEKMDKFITNQQSLNESINKNFQDFLAKQTQLNESQSNFNRNHNTQNSSFISSSGNDQIQFQTQIQIQQLMFNLNAAYHEISAQRNEMTILKENIKQMNARFDQLAQNVHQPFTNHKIFHSIGTVTEDKSEDHQEHHQPRSRSVSTNNALPSYFYNRKPAKNHNNLHSAHQTNRHEVYYTDDFEEDDEEKKSNIIHDIKYLPKITSSNQNLNLTRTFSSSSSKKKSILSSATSTRSTVTSSPSSSIKNLSEYSSSSSTFALRQNKKTNDFLMRLSRIQQLNSRASTSSSHMEEAEKITFDKMREKIYSEVATLISKNEKRPYWLLNIFKELQYLNDKNSRDQALKSIFNISNRQLSNAGSSTSTTNLSQTIPNNKQHVSLVNNDNYDDDDDVITYNYRMKKSMDMDNEDNSSSLNPFENDSLSNTVIFVKSSPSSSRPVHVKSSPSKQLSSIDSVNNNDQEKSTISQEVKFLISKIISSIKFSSDDFESDEEDNTKPFKFTKFDSNCLNNIIDKVIIVLKQSNRHFDYLRLYQNQLSSYLREALNKYENKNLLNCMEDILIDISDILYNELTFYSIMNNSKLINTNIDKNEPVSSLNSFIQDDFRSHNLNLIKSLARNRENNTTIMYNTTETSSRSNSLATTTTTEDENNGYSSGTGEKCYFFDDINDRSDSKENISNKASDMISKNARNSLDLLNRFKYLFKERNFNYLKSYDYKNNNKSSDSSENEDENIDSVTCKVVDINDLKTQDDVTKLLLSENPLTQTNQDQEIIIDDLPDKLDLDKLNSMKNNNENLSSQTPFMVDLDTIIMNSISDDLVGNPDELPELILHQEREEKEETMTNKKENNCDSNEINEEETTIQSSRSQKSESSNSDHFVIIGNSSSSGGNNSDQEIVDLKKEMEKLNENEKIESLDKNNENKENILDNNCEKNQETSN